MEEYLQNPSIFSRTPHFRLLGVSIPTHLLSYHSLMSPVQAQTYSDCRRDIIHCRTAYAAWFFFQPSDLPALSPNLDFLNALENILKYLTVNPLWKAFAFTRLRFTATYRESSRSAKLDCTTYTKNQLSVLFTCSSDKTNKAPLRVDNPETWVSSGLPRRRRRS